MCLQGLRIYMIKPESVCGNAGRHAHRFPPLATLCTRGDYPGDAHSEERRMANRKDEKKAYERARHSISPIH
jgi:hypothetical protein